MSSTRHCNDAEGTTDPSTCLSVLSTGSSRSRFRKRRDKVVQGPLARPSFFFNLSRLWSLSTHSFEAMCSSGSFLDEWLERHLCSPHTRFDKSRASGTATVCVFCNRS
jgi:hypothetical protein